jgi:hypothetical protein
VETHDDTSGADSIDPISVIMRNSGFDHVWSKAAVHVFRVRDGRR